MTGRLPRLIPERERFPSDALPVAGCARCVELANERTRARIYLNEAGVTAANVAIRRHPRH